MTAPPKPTQHEQECALRIYTVLADSNSIEGAVNFIAHALAAHRHRTAEVVATMATTQGGQP